MLPPNPLLERRLARRVTAASRLATTFTPLGARCLAYVKEQWDLHKLNDQSSPVVFVGYEEGEKAYRLLDPNRRRVRDELEGCTKMKAEAWCAANVPKHPLDECSVHVMRCMHVLPARRSRCQGVSE